MVAKIGQLLQPTAALIVFGGTLCAVMVQFPFPVVKQAAGQSKEVSLGVDEAGAQLIKDLLRYAAIAPRGGLISLDTELEPMKDPFLRKAMTLAVDGTHSPDLRERMELEMEQEADREELIPKVFEAAVVVVSINRPAAHPAL
jgi:chemotaxis protein MotA